MKEEELISFLRHNLDCEEPRWEAIASHLCIPIGDKVPTHLFQIAYTYLEDYFRKVGGWTYWDVNTNPITSDDELGRCTSDFLFSLSPLNVEKEKNTLQTLKEANTEHLMAFVLSLFRGVVNWPFRDNYRSSVVCLPGKTSKKDLILLTAVYTTGNTFNSYQTSTQFRVVTGISSMMNLFDALRQRGLNKNSMWGIKSDSPIYPLCSDLQLTESQRWEGYFDHLDKFQPSFYMEDKHQAMLNSTRLVDVYDDED